MGGRGHDFCDFSLILGDDNQMGDDNPLQSVPVRYVLPPNGCRNGHGLGVPSSSYPGNYFSAAALGTASVRPVLPPETAWSGEATVAHPA